MNVLESTKDYTISNNILRFEQFFVIEFNQSDIKIDEFNTEWYKNIDFTRPDISEIHFKFNSEINKEFSFYFDYAKLLINDLNPKLVFKYLGVISNRKKGVRVSLYYEK